MDSIVLRVCFIFVIALLVINVFAFEIFGTTDTSITMDDFIIQLENAPTYNDISINSFVDDLTITADWGVFNGFRDFLNLFSKVLSFIAWFGIMLYNIVVYLGYFLYLLGAQAFSAY